MGLPTREVGADRREPTMKTTMLERRNAWRSLSQQDKQQRLQTIRRRQQRQVEFEILRLSHLR